MATTSSYAPPTPLQDLHILDLLELAGSQHRAGVALAMHQSTVCRSLQMMRQQFRLVPQQGSSFCRYGHNRCLHHLRLAYREHRLMAGLLRLGSDALHQPLLKELETVQRVPPRFHSADHWAALVRHGLLDGAIVGSFSLEQPPDGPAPRWQGLRVLPLGELALQLVAGAPNCRRVLVPRRGTTPWLHQSLAELGYALEQQPLACQEPPAWIKRARDRRLALPLCIQLLEPGWLHQHQLLPLEDQPSLRQHLWLVLPEGLETSREAQRALRRLRARIRQAQALALADPQGRAR